MNSFKKFLPLLVFSLLVLAACSKTPKPGVSTVPTDVMVKDEVTEDTMTEENMMENDTGEGEEAEPEPRFEKNLSCGEIKQEDLRLNCENQLNELVASTMFSAARKYFDFSMCKDLPKSFVGECEAYIDGTGVKGPVTEAELVIYNEAIQPVRVETEEGEDIVAGLTSPTYDKTKCAQLTTSGFREYCESRVDSRAEQAKFEEIVNRGTVAQCDQLTNSGLKSNCKFSFGVFEEPEEVSAPADEEMEGGMEEAVDEEI